jgi:hypothetical protein
MNRRTLAAKALGLLPIAALKSRAR